MLLLCQNKRCSTFISAGVRTKKTQGKKRTFLMRVMQGYDSPRVGICYNFQRNVPITNKGNMLQSISGTYDIPKTLSKPKMKSKWVTNCFEISLKCPCPVTCLSWVCFAGVTKYRQDELPQNQSWICIFVTRSENTFPPCISAHHLWSDPVGLTWGNLKNSWNRRFSHSDNIKTNYYDIRMVWWRCCGIFLLFVCPVRVK